jgi:predicted HicB family RNase H-like nuclease
VRVEQVIHERLAHEALARGRSITALAAEVLTERYSPFPEDVE